MSIYEVSFVHLISELSLSADKPPIEELYQFLEFQLPRQWAPVFGDVPLGPDRKQHGAASLQFSLMGPKLYVNTDEVETIKPVLIMLV